MTENAFLIGLDFGSFKTSVVASNGRRESLRTAVGRPRDHIARALLGTDFEIGERLAEVEMAVDIVRPFAHGALKYGAGVGVKDHDGRCEFSRDTTEVGRHRRVRRRTELLAEPGPTPLRLQAGETRIAPVPCLGFDARRSKDLVVQRGSLRRRESPADEETTAHGRNSGRHHGRLPSGVSRKRDCTAVNPVSAREFNTGICLRRHSQ